MGRPLILACALAAPAAAWAAAPSPTLTRVAAGLWELSGVPGAHKPVRQCISNVIVLAQYEHGRRNCTRTLVSDSGGSAVINYDCGAAGFGHTQIDLLTPRSLRITTQGISNQLPFGYTLQAHRLGACESPSASHH